MTEGYTKIGCGEINNAAILSYKSAEAFIADFKNHASDKELKAVYLKFNPVKEVKK